MASLFSHSAANPQVLAAFSQLSSIYNGLRTVSHSSASRKPSTRSEKFTDCSGSLLKTELCQDLSLEDLPKTLTVSQLVDMFNVFNKKVNTDGEKKTWKESHVSSNTFFENKTGFPISQLKNHLPNITVGEILGDATVQGFLKTAGLNPSVQQRRGFKTERSDRSHGIGQPPIKISALDELKRSVYSKIFPEKKTHQDQPEFQKLVIAHQDNPEVQNKLKVAFAEGYNAKSPSPDAKNTLVTKIIRITLFMVLAFILIQILQIFSAVGGGGVKGLGVLNKEKFQINPEEINITFDDVKGVDEAKQELKEIVEYLSDPDRFTVLGAKLPKGILLVGPPGVGKTLMARAVAGEAGVPFYFASGSEFDEIFVGTGAKRVRQLFKSAKLHAPCVIFIDEIDSVGAKRTSSEIHPYANQTINQLLSEMDGFAQNEGVIVLGATNKKENLDTALLRPGRFDVEVQVSKPDLKGRKDILNHYLSKITNDASVDVDILARGTTGFTGADIENMINQGALKAAIDGSPAVSMFHMEFARDKVLMGPAKKNKIPDEDTNWNTAYHEAGHTLVAFYTKGATPLHKVTIIQRGQALGFTAFIEEKEIYTHTKSQLMAQMDVAMGGRLGEEIIYGTEQVTTGASNDFQQATAIASAMVKRFGMSEKVGIRVFTDPAVSKSKVNEVSPAIQEMIDSEIKRLLQESYERAKSLLKAHSAEHKALAKALMRYETLDKEDIKTVIEGKKIEKLS